MPPNRSTSSSPNVGLTLVLIRSVKVTADEAVPLTWDYPNNQQTKTYTARRRGPPRMSGALSFLLGIHERARMQYMTRVKHTMPVTDVSEACSLLGWSRLVASCWPWHWKLSGSRRELLSAEVDHRFSVSNSSIIQVLNKNNRVFCGQMKRFTVWSSIVYAHRSISVLIL